MLHGTGSALDREPHRFVEHEHVIVLEQRDRLQKTPRLLVRFGADRLWSVELEWRNPDGLARYQPILAVDALAVDAQLAFADDALDVREREAGKARFEKPIDPHAGFVGGDRDGLDAARHRCLRRLGLGSPYVGKRAPGSGPTWLGRRGDRRARMPILTRLGPPLLMKARSA